MRSSSIRFAQQFVGVVIATLVPVVLTAFLTIPSTLADTRERCAASPC